MFGDWGWDSSHAEAQQRRLKSWLASIAGARLVVVECGAGHGDPHRAASPARTIARRYVRTLIRINPRDPEVPDGQISLADGGLRCTPGDRRADRVVDRRRSIAGA